MNLQDLIRRIRNSLGLQKDLPDDTVLGFLRMLEDARLEEISCDELFMKLDEYVEREAGNKDAAQLMPLIRAHMDTCPECCEEYEALLNVVTQSSKNRYDSPRN